jgi:hypothetical protein
LVQVLQAINLDINGSARVSTGSSYQFGGSDYKIEGSNVTNPRIGFITNSTERMRIDSAGNVGIGTASPAHNVEIVATASGSINDTLQIRNNSGATGTGSRIRFINFNMTANSDANGASLGTVRSGDDNAMFFETENAERMRIRPCSVTLVLVQASPAFKLEVNKGSAGDIARFTDGVNANTVIKTSGSVTTFGPDTANALALQTNNAERMRIDSAGGVRINNTANATYSAQLNIYSPSTLNCGIHLRTNTGGSQSQILFGNSNNDSVGSIGTSGTSTSFNTSSDYRIKENVNYNFDATTRLKQLKPARFNFIADANTTVDGFLAHEVQDIVPEAITGTKDATETKEKVVLNTNGQVIAQNIEQADWETGKIADEDGNTQYPTDSTWEATKVIPVYQAIDQSKLVPLLVKTIQELEARITALETTN